MEISNSTEYACLAMLELTRSYGRPELLHLEEIAERQRIPAKYLVQILQLLRRGGLVRSKRGSGGGYFLARPPQQISLGEVHRLIEGPMVPLPCVAASGRPPCPRQSNCGLQPVWAKLSIDLDQVLDQLDFDALLQEYEANRISRQAD